MTLHDLWPTFHSLSWLPCQWCDKLLFHVSAVSRPSFCQILFRHSPLTSTWTRLSKSLEPLWGNRGLQDSQSHCPTHPERWLCDIPLNAKSHRRLLSFDPFFELGPMLEQESLQSNLGTNTENGWRRNGCAAASATAIRVPVCSMCTKAVFRRITFHRYGFKVGYLKISNNIK